MIYITHGVVSDWSRERISHALMIAEARFAAHLQHRTAKYVTVAEAIAGHGDALTIDDASHAGFQAARIARSSGHAVTWLVNGMNVEQNLHYFPFQLSFMLDKTSKTECLFKGRRWDLRSLRHRRIMRFHLKELYMKMRRHEEVEGLVKAISDCLAVPPSRLDRSLSTVTIAELSEAASIGVDLQNHGWSHLNPCLQSGAKRLSEVLLNEEYLSQFRVPKTRVFAPPFGRQVSLSPGSFELMLLADRSMPPSHQDGNTANRRNLQPSRISWPSIALNWPKLTANKLMHSAKHRPL